jgi:hypothetical protein
MANEKGFSNAPEQESTNEKQRQNYILAIANDAYPDAPLNNCIRDAEAIVGILVNQYNFEHQQVTFLKNADRKTILTAFKDAVARITPDDNLLIYYSGHGYYEADIDEGSWVPSGARHQDNDEFISNSDLKKRLEAIKSHHTVLICDSCYSGSLFLTGSTKGFGEEYLEKFPSRWGLASGRLQKVSDGAKGEHSPFAEALLFHLRENDIPLSMMELCIRVIQQVGANTQAQMPIGEPLQVAGHKSGQFIFRPRKVKEKPVISKQTQAATQSTRDIEIVPTKIEKAKTIDLKFDNDKAMRYFTQNNTEAIFGMIKDFAIATENKNAQTAVIMLQAEWNDLKRNEMLGVLSYQEQSLKKNQLNARLLDLINTL